MQFVSYPKSGRTWIRYILYNLNCERLIVFHHDHFEFSDGLKKPHCFNVEVRLARYAESEKLVYLERDPRDVMVSLFYQITGRFRDVYQYRGGVSDFIRDDYFGAENLKRFRDMWDAIVARRRFLRISYEDCHCDAAAVLRQILYYYGIIVSELDLARAISNSSIESMREVEMSMQFPEPWLRFRNNSPKVRKGQVGGFRDVLTERDTAFLNDVFGLETGNVLKAR